MPRMPDNTFRIRGEKLAQALDQNIDREFRDRSEALQVRAGGRRVFNAATISAEAPRRPFPHQSPNDERPAAPGDWN